MLIPTLVVAAACLLLLVLVYRQEGNVGGVALSGTITVAKLLPILLFALIGAACLEILIPEEWITKWLGREAGAKGIFIGSIAGVMMPPGGAVVLYGLVGGLWKAGAGMGTLVALTTSYNLLAIHRLPFELSMLGWKFVALRVVSVLLVAPIAGFFAQFIASQWQNLTLK